MTKTGINNLKRLFLIDGLGAILSAFILGVVLVKLERVFGIPKSTLYFLAFFPCLFAMYDFYCYYKIEKNYGIFLRAIAIVNLLYCCLSIGLGMYHKESVTTLGWIYILIEIFIVSSLALIELKVANNIRCEKPPFA